MLTNLQPFGGPQSLSTHESSHDTFDNDKHSNWLVNGAGVGCYVHGRIHQQVNNVIYVGDLIHKRGFLSTDDLLLMEEQETLSHGEPLSVPTRLGPLMAMAVLPTMNTANGEGSLVAYYQHGVVAYDTFEAPRETRYDGKGVVIQKGWDSKRLVNHMLNTISAVGRYAVAVLTRDHFFRSTRGLHFLKVILGEGTFNSENVNRISQDVDPLLATDPVTALTGAATGFWIGGDRMFATTGLVVDLKLSSSSYGRGFVSWNQATSFTEDRTPRPIWEGLWLMDSGMSAVHCFTDYIDFGFITSDSNANIYHTTVDPTADHDVRDGVEIPIEWSFETGRFAPGGLGARKVLQDCVIEGVFSKSTQKIRVLVRTDVSGDWVVWRTVVPCDKPLPAGSLFRLFEALGRPPIVCREDATWFQLRLEGVGHIEISMIELDYSTSVVKTGRQRCTVVGIAEKDFFAPLEL